MLGKRKYSHFICPAPRSFLCACLALPRLALKMAVLLRQETKNKKISRGRARVRRRQILKTIVRNTLHVASHHLSRRCTSKPLSPCARPSLLCSRGPFQAKHVRGHRRRTQDTLLYNPLFFFQSRGKLNSCKDEREGISPYTHLCSCMSFWLSTVNVSISFCNFCKRYKTLQKRYKWFSSPGESDLNVGTVYCFYKQ